MRDSRVRDFVFVGRVTRGVKNEHTLPNLIEPRRPVQASRRWRQIGGEEYCDSGKLM